MASNIQTKLKRAERRVLPLRAKKSDLDRLPFLDRDLVYRSTRLRRFPVRSFMAGRGCPYPCTYCFNHAFRAVYRGKGRLHNRFSVDRITDQPLFSGLLPCESLRHQEEDLPRTDTLRRLVDVLGVEIRIGPKGRIDIEREASLPSTASYSDEL